MIYSIKINLAPTVPEFFNYFIKNVPNCVNITVKAVEICYSKMITKQII